MKFGSKGLDAPVIIGVIVAVVAAAIILYILWSKGMLPFVSGANEAECTAYFIRSCQAGPKFGGLQKITCKNFAETLSPDGVKTCSAFNAQAPTDENDCRTFCDKVLSTS